MKTVSVSNAQGGFKQAPEGSMKRALVLLPVLLLTVGARDLVVAALSEAFPKIRRLTPGARCRAGRMHGLDDFPLVGERELAVLLDGEQGGCGVFPAYRGQAAFFAVMATSFRGRSRWQLSDKDDPTWVSGCQ
jgi:hypothetical protein